MKIGELEERITALVKKYEQRAMALEKEEITTYLGMEDLKRERNYGRAEGAREVLEIIRGEFDHSDISTYVLEGTLGEWETVYPIEIIKELEEFDLTKIVKGMVRKMKYRIREQ